MGSYKLHTYAGIFIIVLLFSACPKKKPTQVGPTKPPLTEPAVPPGYQKIAPLPLESSQQILAQTATIFRGVLKEVKFTYDDCAGPRTNYVFSNSSTLAGTQIDPNVTLKVLGGPTPKGTWIRVSELPQLALDSEYVAFLRNTDWTFSPVVGNLVFRRENVNGREVLIAPTGHVVTGWGDDGPVLSIASVSETVGSHLRGYKGSEAPPQPEHSTSAEENPNGEPMAGNSNSSTTTARPTEASAIARAPSAEEAKKAGLFVKPVVSAAALANQPAFSTVSLIAAVNGTAERANIRIGGRLSLDPYWKCWSYTNTAKGGR